MEWDETVRTDTDLLGFTTKHIHFSGPSKNFQVGYDRIVDFEQFRFGIMRSAQTAKHQSFPTGAGRPTFSLATNPAPME